MWKYVKQFWSFILRRPKLDPNRIPGPNHPYTLYVERKVTVLVDSKFLEWYRFARFDLLKNLYGWEFRDCGVKTTSISLHVNPDADNYDPRMKGYVSFETRADMIVWKLKHQLAD